MGNVGVTLIDADLRLMAGCHSEGDRKGTPLLYAENPLARLVYSRDGACPRPRIGDCFDLKSAPMGVTLAVTRLQLSLL